MAWPLSSSAPAADPFLYRTRPHLVKVRRHEDVLQRGFELHPDLVLQGAHIGFIGKLVSYVS